MIVIRDGLINGIPGIYAGANGRSSSFRADTGVCPASLQSIKPVLVCLCWGDSRIALLLLSERDSIWERHFR